MDEEDDSDDASAHSYNDNDDCCSDDHYDDSGCHLATCDNRQAMSTSATAQLHGN